MIVLWGAQQSSGIRIMLSVTASDKLLLDGMVKSDYTRCLTQSSAMYVADHTKTCQAQW